GRAALRDRARVGTDGPGDRPPHGRDAIPGDRDLADGVAAAHEPGLPALRRPARCTADTAAAPAVLRGAGADPGGAEPQASRRGGAPRRGGDRAPARAPRPDGLPPEPLEVPPGLQRRAPVE